MVDQHQGYIGYFDRDSCDLDEFKILTSQSLEMVAVPYAVDVQKNIPIYDVNALRSRLEDEAERKAILTEWAWVLGRSAGVLVLKSAYADTAPVDAASRLYDQIIAEERVQSGGGADHFATAGSNDRIILCKSCA